MPPEIPAFGIDPEAEKKLSKCKELIKSEIVWNKSFGVDEVFQELSSSEKSEIIDWLTKRIETYKKDPDGLIYKTAETLFNRLSTLLGVSGVSVESTPIEISEPEIKSTAGEKPSVEKKIRKERELRPDGWMTSTELSKKLKISEVKVVAIASELTKWNPDWIKKYANKPFPLEARMVEYFHPDLIEKIRQEYLKMLEKNPALQRAAQSLAVQESLKSAFQQRIEKERAALAARKLEITSEVSKGGFDKIPAPKGWRTNFSLSFELRTSEQDIAQMAYKHFDSHPEWFKRYLDGTRKLSLHYSPELVESIRAEKAKELADWEAARSKE